jgi:hypothetical protein
MLAHTKTGKEPEVKYLLCLGVAVLLAATGCGPKVMVPPKIDLAQHEVVGVITFRSSNEGLLGSYATGKFIEAVRRDQGLVRVVEIGDQDEVLEKIGSKELDREAFVKIGEEYDVATVFNGELVLSDIRPEITITPGGGYMDFSAEVDATMAVRLMETETGASLWNSSAAATRKVGGVSVFGHKHFAFNAKDPDVAYGELVRAMVRKASRDFQVTWERQ